MRYSGINLEDVKVRNRSAILELFNNKGSMSRKDIADSLSLTAAAVTQISTDMIKDNILVEKGEMAEEKRAGRKKVLLDINYDWKKIVSVFIETNKTHINLTNMHGDKICGKVIDTNKHKEPSIFLKEICNEINKLLYKIKIDTEDVLGIGICIPGIVDKTKGISVRAYGIWEKEVRVAEIMKGFIDCHVVVENNVRAFAEGELVYGIGKNKNDLIFIKWGPGVGSAIVIDNKVYDGKEFLSGEIGHYILEPKGRLCTCGRYGCLETKVSVSSIEKAIEEVYSETNTPILYDLTEGNINNVVNLDFFNNIELWHKIDEPIKNIFDDCINNLAIVIVNTITILAPAQVVVYGSVLENEYIRNVFIKKCNEFDSSFTSEYITKASLSHKKYYIGNVATVMKECFFKKGAIY